MTKRDEDLDIEELFELIGKHGIEDRSEQARLLLKMIINAPDQTRPTLWVHQAAASVTEKRGAESPESAPHRTSTWPMHAAPFEETNLVQKSDCQQSGAVSGPISQDTDAMWTHSSGQVRTTASGPSETTHAPMLGIARAAGGRLRS